MTFVEVIVAFAIIWWVVLFIVLPFGVRSHHEEGIVDRAIDPGAPVRPQMGRKILVTTFVALLVLGFFYVGRTSGIISLDNIIGLNPIVSE
ncbi:MAG: DUF1467 family protein [Alphaproteobacteria bacterium]|jgi:predicted secreted protein